MSLQSEIAYKHKTDRLLLQNDLIRRVKQLWSFGNVADLDGSWDALAPRITQQVAQAQVAAARQATPYMDAVDRSYGRATPAGQLAVESFSDVTLDGRELAPALYGSVTKTKELIGRGMAPPNAFIAGANALATLASAALQDMGRQADITLGRSRTYTRYVRVVGAGACSRCGILAGQWSAEKAFLRHLGCQCTAMPVQVIRESGDRVKYKTPEGFFEDPSAFFDSLSKEEQDKKFTIAGAEAIRNGADIGKVVNARRGAYGIGYSGHYNVPVPVGTRNSLQKLTIGRKPDGSPLQVYATVEGTTARGEFGRTELRAGSEASKEGRYRRTATVRLMPEQLIKMAGDDTARFVELLKRYGYMY